MSKFYFEQVFTKPTAETLWPEEYFLSINEARKHERLLAIYAHRDSLLNVNGSWSSTQTALERRMTVEMSESEYEQHQSAIDDITGADIVPGTGYSAEDNAIIDDVFEYCKQAGIFFRTGFNEVDNLGNTFPITLSTTDDTAQQEFLDLYGA